MPNLPNRLERRKARTRAALVGAAQDLLAADRAGVAVSEITKAADVGLGTFYNHFSSKEELFDAAVLDAVERHGDLMDSLTDGMDDPAVAFAHSFRLTGRLHRREPMLSKVLLSRGVRIALAEDGLAPRALRDIRRGIEAGRFTVGEPQLALVVVSGAMLCLGQLLHDQPERDDAEASDTVAEELLRMLGLEPGEARQIAHSALPSLDQRGQRLTAGPSHWTDATKV